METLPVQPPLPISQKPPISLNLAFLIITVVSLALSGFFIFQNFLLNQKLQQLIKARQVQDSSNLPTPTCRPRPACLDATPRCLIPETPDMCPPSTSSGIPAGWQTFTSEKFGYRFSYPGSWNGSDFPDGTSFSDNNNDGIGQLEGVVLDINNLISLDPKTGKFISKWPVVNIGTTTVDGFSATRFQGEPIQGTDTEMPFTLGVVVQHNSTFLSHASSYLTIAFNSFHKGNLDPLLFDRILSTFKFTQ